MSRSLSSIQKIIDIKEIENADKIELATIEGWHCVVGKGEYKVNDLIVYCEVDSVLPVKPEFEFLRKGCYVDNGMVSGFRIKTRKFKGQYSQGLVLPISVLNGKKYPKDTRDNPSYEFKEGQDVTPLLEIVKFEKPIPVCLQGEVKGFFPSFIPKTDETRVQVLQKLLTKYKGTPCYITEKVDGTSCTMYLKDGEFGVCSRNLELKPDSASYHEKPKFFKRTDGKYQLLDEKNEPIGDVLDTEPTNPIIKENVYWKMARENDVENKLRKLGKNLAIQGEIFGNGLQGNPLKVPFQKYVLFSVFDIDKQQYLSGEELLDLAGEFHMASIPIINSFYPLSDNIDELVEMAKGNSFYNPQCKREGIVIRPIDGMVDMDFTEECMKGRVSFKSINQEYLVENDD
jgi:RNA ligase (TIGR02306 family)